MIDYLFEIVDEDCENCGEQFFVECETYAEAADIVADNFPFIDVRLIDEYTPEEAEILGYDTY